jgi:hypothetical protein
MTLSSVVATLLVLVNLYIATVKKPRDDQQAGIREVERALNEFLTTYSGEYTELKVKYEGIVKEVEAVKQEQRVQNVAIDEIARDLLKHELTTVKPQSKEVK